VRSPWESLIKKAWYGYAGEAAHDVTQAIKNKMAGTNNINVAISAQNLGLSGLSSNNRQLTVTYAYGTVDGPGSYEVSKSGLDGQTLKLNYLPPGIIFNRVTYGTNQIFVDITKAMQENIFLSESNMIFTVGSPDFLTRYARVDPAPFITKICCIYYRYNINNSIAEECIVARDFEEVNLNFGPGTV